VKSILKASGERYKSLRDAGEPLYQMPKQEGKRDVVKKPVKSTKSDDKVSSLMDKLGVFDKENDTPDALQKIKGIGPQMEKVLNQIGIFKFAQVSKMTKAEYDLLDSITEKFPGRAQRDDWAGQAKKLKE
jgi:molybdopterin-containing oxidoreductase family membrane subunit